MPGVPPDAVAQIKKSLRGLFGRKKKNQVEASPSSDPYTAPATTPAAPVSASSAPPATQSNPNPPPPQPSTTTSAGKADATVPPSGDPAAPAPSEPQLQKSAIPEKPTSSGAKPPAATAPGDTSDPPARQTTTEGTGMSATSGPLEDQHEFSDVGRAGTGAAVPLEGAGVGSASKPVNVDAVKT